MQLHIHSQTSAIAPLKFGNGWVISSHTLPGMGLLIRAGIKVKPCEKMGHGSLGNFYNKLARNKSDYFALCYAFSIIWIYYVTPFPFIISVHIHSRCNYWNTKFAVDPVHYCLLSNTKENTQDIHFLVLVNEAPSDLAANRPTWQSTVLGRDSSFAVDGVLTTRYEDGSCIHTEPAPAIWSVDLSTAADIFYVDVLNRAENAGKTYRNVVCLYVYH